MPSGERAGINPAPTVREGDRRPRNTGDFVGNTLRLPRFRWSLVMTHASAFHREYGAETGGGEEGIGKPGRDDRGQNAATSQGNAEGVKN